MRRIRFSFVHGGLGLFLLGFLLVSCQEDQTNPVVSKTGSSSQVAGTPVPLGKVVPRNLADFFKGQTNPFYWYDPSHDWYHYFVDYGNFYTAYLGLPTTYTGTITEQPLSDGTAEVVVDLKSDNAFTNVYQVVAPFGYIMGASVNDVKFNNATAQLGSVRLYWDFINTGLGAPIPNLSSKGTKQVKMEATVYGPLSYLAQMGPTGTPGEAWTNQVGLLTHTNGDASADGYTAEYVKVKVVGKNK